MQTGWKDNPGFVPPETFLNRHDTRMRLTPLGVELAKATGEWLRQEFADGFERYYTMPLTRTIETAGRLTLQGDWRIDNRWRPG